MLVRDGRDLEAAIDVALNVLPRERACPVFDGGAVTGRRAAPRLELLPLQAVGRRRPIRERVRAEKLEVVLPQERRPAEKDVVTLDAAADFAPTWPAIGRGQPFREVGRRHVVDPRDAPHFALCQARAVGAELDAQGDAARQPHGLVLVCVVLDLVEHHAGGVHGAGPRDRALAQTLVVDVVAPLLRGADFCRDAVEAGVEPAAVLRVAAAGERGGPARAARAQRGGAGRDPARGPHGGPLAPPLALEGVPLVGAHVEEHAAVRVAGPRRGEPRQGLHVARKHHVHVGVVVRHPRACVGLGVVEHVAVQTHRGLVEGLVLETRARRVLLELLHALQHRGGLPLRGMHSEEVDLVLDHLHGAEVVLHLDVVEPGERLQERAGDVAPRPAPLGLRRGRRVARDDVHKRLVVCDARYVRARVALVPREVPDAAVEHALLQSVRLQELQQRPRAGVLALVRHAPHVERRAVGAHGVEEFREGGAWLRRVRDLVQRFEEGLQRGGDVALQILALPVHILLRELACALGQPLVARLGEADAARPRRARGGGVEGHVGREEHAAHEPEGGDLVERHPVRVLGGRREPVQPDACDFAVVRGGVRRPARFVEAGEDALGTPQLLPVLRQRVAGAGRAVPAGELEEQAVHPLADLPLLRGRVSFSQRLAEACALVAGRRGGKLALLVLERVAVVAHDGEHRHDVLVHEAQLLAVGRGVQQEAVRPALHGVADRVLARGLEVRDHDARGRDVHAAHGEGLHRAVRDAGAARELHAVLAGADVVLLGLQGEVYAQEAELPVAGVRQPRERDGLVVALPVGREGVAVVPGAVGGGGRAPEPVAAHDRARETLREALRVHEVAVARVRLHGQDALLAERAARDGGGPHHPSVRARDAVDVQRAHVLAARRAARGASGRVEDLAVLEPAAVRAQAVRPEEVGDLLPRRAPEGLAALALQAALGPRVREQVVPQRVVERDDGVDAPPLAVAHRVLAAVRVPGALHDAAALLRDHAHARRVAAAHAAHVHARRGELAALAVGVRGARLQLGQPARLRAPAVGGRGGVLHVAREEVLRRPQGVLRPVRPREQQAGGLPDAAPDRPGHVGAARAARLEEAEVLALAVHGGRLWRDRDGGVRAREDVEARAEAHVVEVLQRQPEGARAAGADDAEVVCAERAVGERGVAVDEARGLEGAVEAEAVCEAAVGRLVGAARRGGVHARRAVPRLGPPVVDRVAEERALGGRALRGGPRRPRRRVAEGGVCVGRGRVRAGARRVLLDDAQRVRAELLGHLARRGRARERLELRARVAVGDVRVLRGPVQRRVLARRRDQAARVGQRAARGVRDHCRRVDLGRARAARINAAARVVVPRVGPAQDAVARDPRAGGREVDQRERARRLRLVDGRAVEDPAEAAQRDGVELLEALPAPAAHRRLLRLHVRERGGLRRAGGARGREAQQAQARGLHGDAHAGGDWRGLRDALRHREELVDPAAVVARREVLRHVLLAPALPDGRGPARRGAPLRAGVQQRAPLAGEHALDVPRAHAAAAVEEGLLRGEAAREVGVLGEPVVRRVVVVQPPRGRRAHAVALPAVLPVREDRVAHGGARARARGARHGDVPGGDARAARLELVEARVRAPAVARLAGLLGPGDALAHGVGDVAAAVDGPPAEAGARRGAERAGVAVRAAERAEREVCAEHVDAVDGRARDVGVLHRLVARRARVPRVARRARVPRVAHERVAGEVPHDVRPVHGRAQPRLGGDALAERLERAREALRARDPVAVERVEARRLVEPAQAAGERDGQRREALLQEPVAVCPEAHVRAVRRVEPAERRADLGLVVREQPLVRAHHAERRGLAEVLAAPQRARLAVRGERRRVAREEVAVDEAPRELEELAHEALGAQRRVLGAVQARGEERRRVALRAARDVVARRRVVGALARAAVGQLARVGRAVARAPRGAQVVQQLAHGALDALLEAALVLAEEDVAHEVADRGAARVAPARVRRRRLVAQRGARARQLELAGAPAVRVAEPLERRQRALGVARPEVGARVRPEDHRVEELVQRVALRGEEREVERVRLPRAELVGVEQRLHAGVRLRVLAARLLRAPLGVVGDQRVLGRDGHAVRAAPGPDHRGERAARRVGVVEARGEARRGGRGREAGRAREDLAAGDVLRADEAVGDGRVLEVPDRALAPRGEEVLQARVVGRALREREAQARRDGRRERGLRGGARGAQVRRHAEEVADGRGVVCDEQRGGALVPLAVHVVALAAHGGREHGDALLREERQARAGAQVRAGVRVARRHALQVRVGAVELVEDLLVRVRVEREERLAHAVDERERARAPERAVRDALAGARQRDHERRVAARARLHGVGLVVREVAVALVRGREHVHDARDDALQPREAGVEGVQDGLERDLPDGGHALADELVHDLREAAARLGGLGLAHRLLVVLGEAARRDGVRRLRELAVLEAQLVARRPHDRVQERLGVAEHGLLRDDRRVEHPQRELREHVCRRRRAERAHGPRVHGALVLRRRHGHRRAHRAVDLVHDRVHEARQQAHAADDPVLGLAEQREEDHVEALELAAVGAAPRREPQDEDDDLADRRPDALVLDEAELHGRLQQPARGAQRALEVHDRPDAARDRALRRRVARALHGRDAAAGAVVDGALPAQRDVELGALRRGLLRGGGAAGPLVPLDAHLLQPRRRRRERRGEEHAPLVVRAARLERVLREHDGLAERRGALREPDGRPVVLAQPEHEREPGVERRVGARVQQAAGEAVARRVGRAPAHGAALRVREEQEVVALLGETRRHVPVQVAVEVRLRVRREEVRPRARRLEAHDQRDGLGRRRAGADDEAVHEREVVGRGEHPRDAVHRGLPGRGDRAGRERLEHDVRVAVRAVHHDAVRERRDEVRAARERDAAQVRRPRAAARDLPAHVLVRADAEARRDAVLDDLDGVAVRRADDRDAAVRRGHAAAARAPAGRGDVHDGDLHHPVHLEGRRGAPLEDLLRREEAVHDRLLDACLRAEVLQALAHRVERVERARARRPAALRPAAPLEVVVRLGHDRHRVRAAEEVRAAPRVGVPQDRRVVDEPGERLRGLVRVRHRGVERAAQALLDVQAHRVAHRGPRELADAPGVRAHKRRDHRLEVLGRARPAHVCRVRLEVLAAGVAAQAREHRRHHEEDLDRREERRLLRDGRAAALAHEARPRVRGPEHHAEPRARAERGQHEELPEVVLRLDERVPHERRERLRHRVAREELEQQPRDRAPEELPHVQRRRAERLHAEAAAGQPREEVARRRAEQRAVPVEERRLHAGERRLLREGLARPLEDLAREAHRPRAELGAHLLHAVREVAELLLELRVLLERVLVHAPAHVVRGVCRVRRGVLEVAPPEQRGHLLPLGYGHALQERVHRLAAGQPAEEPPELRDHHEEVRVRLAERGERVVEAQQAPPAVEQQRVRHVRHRALAQPREHAVLEEHRERGEERDPHPRAERRARADLADQAAELRHVAPVGAQRARARAELRRRRVGQPRLVLADLQRLRLQEVRAVAHLLRVVAERRERAHVEVRRRGVQDRHGDVLLREVLHARHDDVEGAPAYGRVVGLAEKHPRHFHAGPAGRSVAVPLGVRKRVHAPDADAAVARQRLDLQVVVGAPLAVLGELAEHVEARVHRVQDAPARLDGGVVPPGARRPRVRDAHEVVARELVARAQRLARRERGQLRVRRHDGERLGALLAVQALHLHAHRAVCVVHRDERRRPRDRKGLPLQQHRLVTLVNVRNCCAVHARHDGVGRDAGERGRVEDARLRQAAPERVVAVLHEEPVPRGRRRRRVLLPGRQRGSDGSDRAVAALQLHARLPVLRVVDREALRARAAAPRRHAVREARGARERARADRVERAVPGAGGLQPDHGVHLRGPVVPLVGRERAERRPEVAPAGAEAPRDGQPRHRPAHGVDGDLGPRARHVLRGAGQREADRHQQARRVERLVRVLRLEARDRAVQLHARALRGVGVGDVVALAAEQRERAPAALVHLLRLVVLHRRDPEPGGYLDRPVVAREDRLGRPAHEVELRGQPVGERERRRAQPDDPRLVPPEDMRLRVELDRERARLARRRRLAERGEHDHPHHVQPVVHEPPGVPRARRRHVEDRRKVRHARDAAEARVGEGRRLRAPRVRHQRHLHHRVQRDVQREVQRLRKVRVQHGVEQRLGGRRRDRARGAQEVQHMHRDHAQRQHRRQEVEHALARRQARRVVARPHRLAVRHQRARQRAEHGLQARDRLQHGRHLRLQRRHRDRAHQPAQAELHGVPERHERRKHELQRLQRHQQHAPQRRAHAAVPHAQQARRQPRVGVRQRPAQVHHQQQNRREQHVVHRPLQQPGERLRPRAHELDHQVRRPQQQRARAGRLGRPRARRGPPDQRHQQRRRRVHQALPDTHHQQRARKHQRDVWAHRQTRPGARAAGHRRGTRALALIRNYTRLGSPTTTASFAALAKTLTILSSVC